MKTVILEINGWRKRVDIPIYWYNEGVYKCAFPINIPSSIAHYNGYVELELLTYNFCRTGENFKGIPIFKVEI